MHWGRIVLVKIWRENSVRLARPVTYGRKSGLETQVQAILRAIHWPLPPRVFRFHNTRSFGNHFFVYFLLHKPNELPER